MNFEVSKRARRQITKIQTWWTENRPAACSLFLDELAAAERQLRATPELGAAYTEHKSGKVRRVLLPKTHHHLYYRYRPERDELVVLAVWGSPRGRGPKL